MTLPPTKLRAQLEEAKRQLRDSIHAQQSTSASPSIDHSGEGEERPARAEGPELCQVPSLWTRGEEEAAVALRLLDLREAEEGPLLEPC